MYLVKSLMALPPFAPYPLYRFFQSRDGLCFKHHAAILCFGKIEISRQIHVKLDELQVKLFAEGGTGFQTFQFNLGWHTELHSRIPP